MNLTQARRNALRALIPPKKINLSRWIEDEIRLPEGLTALPGPVQLWPFQREIADAIGDRLIERVTLVKPVRVGFTTLLTAAVAGSVANDPGNILCLLPTDSDCRDYMVSDLEPIFAASPLLVKTLSDDQAEGERNTLMSRRFPGGSLKVVAAKAPRNLRRHNVRDLFMDEVDGMENTPEGSPILLAEKRTLSFPDRKIVMGSTPVHEDTSHVLRAYAQSDMRVFEVPCPECGGFAEIQWGQIVWGEEGPESAAWECPACKSLVSERNKPAMVSAGRWRATRPEVQSHAGFRLNALVSLHANASWAKLAREWLASKDDPVTLQTFVNTILAQGWKSDGEDLDDGALADSAVEGGLGQVPADVLVLTAGVDVQHDRLEVSVLGWAAEGGMTVLGHEVIDGRWDENETWADLDQFLGQTFQHELGGQIGISAAAVDSGDGTTSAQVIQYCRARTRRKIMAIKGEDGMTRQLMDRSRSKARERLWIVGSDTGKRMLRERLTRGGVRFSTDLPRYWYEQLASERLVTRYMKGRPVHRFERIPGRRAEALDCVVYAMAARQVLAVDWGQSRAELSVADPASVRRSVQQPTNDWLGAPRDGWLR